MTKLLTRIQLGVFAVVTVLAVTYGAVTLFDVNRIVSPPYLVEAQFANAGGIYPRADVDLLGTRVGRVKELKPGPGAGTTVVMAIDPEIAISSNVTALIGNKSAIGEQYVELTPLSAEGPMLADGDVIPLKDTSAPIEVATLLGNLESLAASVDTKKVATVLQEFSTAVRDLGPTMGQLLDDADTVTRYSLDDVKATTSLIESARTVLDTQVAKGPETATYLRELGSLTEQLLRLNPDFADLFAQGIRSGDEITALLRENREVLPLLLDDLVSLTTAAHLRVDGIRKTLVIFPWVLEAAGSAIRYCDEYNPVTGKAVAATCHYDENGRPIYSAHLAVQLPEPPGGPQYLPCQRGYGGTVRYLPDGTPQDGGPKQGRDTEPNRRVACTAPPTDPVTPNVRGAQNARLRPAL
ncbi:MAG TPA: MCE family protein [Nocardioidaceae bacterium]|nr:MCE family protein [Nocardioidaceae bacterium]